MPITTYIYRQVGQCVHAVYHSHWIPAISTPHSVLKQTSPLFCIATDDDGIVVETFGYISNSWLVKSSERWTCLISCTSVYGVVYLLWLKNTKIQYILNVPSIPLSLCNCLCLTFANHISPRGYLTHFLHFSLWSWLTYFGWWIPSFKIWNTTPQNNTDSIY